MKNTTMLTLICLLLSVMTMAPVVPVRYAYPDGFWHVHRDAQIDSRQCRAINYLQTASDTWLYACQMPDSDRWQVIHGRKAYGPAVSVTNVRFEEGAVKFRSVDVYGRMWDHAGDKITSYVPPRQTITLTPNPRYRDSNCFGGCAAQTATRTMPVRNACGKQVRDYILADNEPLVAIYGFGKTQVCLAQENYGSFEEVKDLTFHQSHVRFTAKDFLNGWYLVQDKVVISKPFMVGSIPIGYFDEIDGVIYTDNGAVARGRRDQAYYLLEDAWQRGPYDKMTKPIDAGKGVVIYATWNKKPADKK